jgi:hypothetical protein
VQEDPPIDPEPHQEQKKNINQPQASFRKLPQRAALEQKRATLEQLRMALEQ